MLNTDAIHSLTLELGDLMLSDVKWIVQDCFQCNDQGTASFLFLFRPLAKQFTHSYIFPFPLLPR